MAVSGKRPGARFVAPARKTHFVSPRLARRLRQELGGYGVFAVQPVPAGELLVVWGGTIASTGELDELAPVARRHSIQVEESLYMVPHELPEIGDFVNHSCNPNAGLSGQLALVALRQIAKGEEICYDYAMSDGSPYDEFACSCGARDCRRRVSGNDWALPELQRRYCGYFSPYLQRRINGARALELAKCRLSAVPGLLADAP